MTANVSHIVKSHRGNLCFLSTRDSPYDPTLDPDGGGAGLITNRMVELFSPERR